MIKIIITLCVILFAYNAHTQEVKPPEPEPRPQTQLLLNITIPCREDGVMFISELVEIYGEKEFASGTFKFKPIGGDFVYSDLLMYVAPDKSTFSIFSMHKVGGYEVACVLAGGTNLKPFDGIYRE